MDTGDRAGLCGEYRGAYGDKPQSVLRCLTATLFFSRNLKKRSGTLFADALRLLGLAFKFMEVRILLVFGIILSV